MKTHEFKNFVRRHATANKVDMSETRVCCYARLYRKYVAAGQDFDAQKVRKAVENSIPYHVFTNYKEMKATARREHLEKMRLEKVKRSKPASTSGGGKKKGKKGSSQDN